MDHAKETAAAYAPLFIAGAIQAVALVALLLADGLSPTFAAHAALSFILLAIALIDLGTRTIPNELVLAIMAIWLIRMIVLWGSETLAETPTSQWGSQVLDGLAGAFLVGGGTLIFSLAFSGLSGRESLGGGDIKLLFALGLHLGVSASLVNLLIACALGLLASLIRGLTSKSSLSELLATSMPFGPAIAAATIITLVLGPSILT